MKRQEEEDGTFVPTLALGSRVLILKRLGEVEKEAIPLLYKSSLDDLELHLQSPVW